MFTNPLTANTITRPWYVLEIRLKFETIYASTGTEAYWNGITFKQGIIDSQVNLSTNQEQLKVGIIDVERKYTLSALRNEFLGGDVTVWSVPAPINMAPFVEPGYVEEGYEEAVLIPEPVLVFKGTISEIPRADDVVEIAAIKRNIGGFPRIRINTPLANFTARPGTTITVSGKTYTITQRSYE